MPRPTVTYRKAGNGSMTKDKERKPYQHLMKKPDALSEIAQYVELNRHDGTSTLELIREFQAQHTHGTWKVLAATGHYNSVLTLYMCEECGLLKTAVPRKKK